MWESLPTFVQWTIKIILGCIAGSFLLSLLIIVVLVIATIIGYKKIPKYFNCKEWF